LVHIYSRLHGLHSHWHQNVQPLALVLKYCRENYKAKNIETVLFAAVGTASHQHGLDAATSRAVGRRPFTAETSPSVTGGQWHWGQALPVSVSSHQCSVFMHILLPTLCNPSNWQASLNKHK
jgi:hypothetical protein